MACDDAPADEPLPVYTQDVGELVDTTAVIGLLVATFMHKRTSSGLAFFFWFVATDAILTLAIYGVNFLGVF